VARLGLPLMVKPDQGGSALGTQVVRTAEDLPAAMVDCLAYGNAVLAERFLTGTEWPSRCAPTRAQGTAGGRDLCQGRRVRLHRAVYPGATTFHCPARLPESVQRAAEQVALDAHRLLGLRDLSRTDAIVTEDGVVHVLEVNVSPGLTETSLLPTAATAAGEHLGQLFSGLIDEAIRRA